MKLISWNVNGLRACMTKGFAEYFAAQGADCFCIQETKLQPGQIDFAPEGYRAFWNSADKKGYSGTAIFAKQEPLAVRYDMGVDEHDHEGRVIDLEYETFHMVTVYTPNSQRGLTRLEYRMTWENAFADYLCRLDAEKPVIVCGDLNVAHQEIDLKHPKANVQNAGFTPQERDKLSTLLGRGFTDSFRLLHPDARDRYTWWSYMANSRAKNVGWRIDYFLVSNRLAPKILRAEIDDGVMGSDHCPILLEIQP
ncbi:MAG TPA: exodeoxyribonuclease III [Candidatus Limiplasma sp.]|nr:exodeoxyribonuclease III [Candidatus Limiplasma sp.]